MHYGKYKSQSNESIMILTNHFEPLTAMYNQHSIAIKIVLLSECQNAGLASINDSKVANNQTTLAHVRHNDTNHDETVMAMHNTNKNSSPQVKCESNDAPLIWNAACPY